MKTAHLLLAAGLAIVAAPAAPVADETKPGPSKDAKKPPAGKPASRPTTRPAPKYSDFETEALDRIGKNDLSLAVKLREKLAQKKSAAAKIAYLRKRIGRTGEEIKAYTRLYRKGVFGKDSFAKVDRLLQRFVRAIRYMEDLIDFYKSGKRPAWYAKLLKERAKQKSAKTGPTSKPTGTPAPKPGKPVKPGGTSLGPGGDGGQASHMVAVQREDDCVGSLHTISFAQPDGKAVPVLATTKQEHSGEREDGKPDDAPVQLIPGFTPDEELMLLLLDRYRPDLARRIRRTWPSGEEDRTAILDELVRDAARDAVRAQEAQEGGFGSAEVTAAAQTASAILTGWRSYRNGLSPTLISGLFADEVADIRDRADAAWEDKTIESGAPLDGSEDLWDVRLVDRDYAPADMLRLIAHEHRFTSRGERVTYTVEGVGAAEFDTVLRISRLDPTTGAQILNALRGGGDVYEHLALYTLFAVRLQQRLEAAPDSLSPEQRQVYGRLVPLLRTLQDEMASFQNGEMSAFGGRGLDYGKYRDAVERARQLGAWNEEAGQDKASGPGKTPAAGARKAAESPADSDLGLVKARTATVVLIVNGASTGTPVEDALVKFLDDEPGLPGDVKAASAQPRDDPYGDTLPAGFTGGDGTVVAETNGVSGLSGDNRGTISVDEARPARLIVGLKPDSREPDVFATLFEGPAASLKIEAAQALLTEAGFDPGPADGRLTAKTMAAIDAYRRKAGLPAGSNADRTLMTALLRGTGLFADDALNRGQRSYPDSMEANGLDDYVDSVYSIGDFRLVILAVARDELADVEARIKESADIAYYEIDPCFEKKRTL